MIVRLVGTAVLTCGLGLAPAVPAVAGPAPSWTNERLLQCEEGEVRTFLTPAGFGSPFHVVGSTEVIVPKYVEVVLPGGEGPFVTVDVPGFDPTADGAVHCWYVDPVGLQVDLRGLRR
ncbi:hypothetical protein [Ornithinimicrobium flavum]|uniref:hypothetical protein n=1 Tax=Ornithinimicrobium flavum TaxID=1288636 RepID=UPI00107032A9|nr:hypothetical protein [Ornithinimicrobium flavum]